MNRSQQLILGYLRDDPGITFRSLAVKVGLPLSTAFDYVQDLRELGVIDYGKCPTCGRGIILVEGEERERTC